MTRLITIPCRVSGHHWGPTSAEGDPDHPYWDAVHALHDAGAHIRLCGDCGAAFIPRGGPWTPDCWPCTNRRHRHTEQAADRDAYRRARQAGTDTAAAAHQAVATTPTAPAAATPEPADPQMSLL